MVRFLADENFNNDIMRGVLRRNAEIDVVRIQDIGLTGIEDPEVLERAAKQNRILLSHDVATITKYAYERVATGLPMPGVFEVGHAVPVSVAIDDILLIAELSLENEWEGQVIYLPLR